MVMVNGKKIPIKQWAVWIRTGSTI